MDTSDRVIVVGAGISGVACAAALERAGVPVTVLDRGMRMGGRMASTRIDGRAVDLGASYFTVSDDRFATEVARWEQARIAAPWTDTFEVRETGKGSRTKQGPVRWRAPGALRSLVEELASGLDVQRQVVEQVSLGSHGPVVDGAPAAAVVLAMPDPQAARLLGGGLDTIAAGLDRTWDPVLALVATFAERAWSLDGAFVNDDPDLDWVADDGRRRGDGAPVLVAHSTSERAAQHLDDPDGAEPHLRAALLRVLGLDVEPVSTLVKRWSVARPAGERSAPYLLDALGVGVCGDGWGTPKVEGAYLSGRALGEALASRLTR